MKIQLLAVGQKMPKWVQTGYGEYSKRLPPHLRLQLIDIRPGNRRKGADSAMREEAQALLARRASGDRLIALDEKGKQWSTRKLAENLQNWMLGGQPVSLAIGGPDGHHDDVRTQAETLWSLGPLTLPHPVVRVVLAEQIYRAWTILEGHPYHRS